MQEGGPRGTSGNDCNGNVCVSAREDQASRD